MFYKAAFPLKKWLTRYQELLEDHRYKKLATYHITGGYQRIYLYHIQKTGGTSLNYMFLSLGGEDPLDVYNRLAAKGLKARRTLSNDKVYVGWDKKLIEDGNYFYAFSHTPKHRLRIPEETFTITCLRDPKKRVLSLYKEFFEYKLNDVDHPCRVYSDNWLGNSFHDFLRNAPQKELLRQLYMFSPTFDIEEALENILACSFFFRTEEFSQGCDELSKRLKINLLPLHVRKTTINAAIKESELLLLESILKPEYELMAKLEQRMKHNL
ncbi:MAG TPA: sulfotransferase family 2 domain-containing protein [Anaerolineales bacterium]|nr:sulfotransferase family 2 domain-containing protein [Anaerolineales bacterium]